MRIDARIYVRPITRDAQRFVRRNVDVVRSRDEVGGADGIRTHDLLDAIEARSQLRHGPTG